jgi:hypothetical protein
MELPEPDPSKLLQAWMEWERGEVTPGRVMANLKTGGMRELLEGLVAQRSAGPGQGAGGQESGEPQAGEGQAGQPASWSPVV